MRLLAALAQTSTTIDLDPPGNITSQEASVVLLLLLLLMVGIAVGAFLLVESSR